MPNRLHLKIAEGFDKLRGAATVEEDQSALRTLLGRLHAAGLIDPVFSERARTLRAQYRAAARKRADSAELATAA